MKSRSKPATESPYRPFPINSYGGLSATDRQTQRRERLIEAAAELFGSAGYANTTIGKICETAGCALRTFYEEFGSREALLKVIYDRIAAAIIEETFTVADAAGDAPSEAVRAGIRAYVRAITSDAKRARIMLIEAVGVSRELDTSRREAQSAFVGRVVALTQRMGLRFDRDDFELTSMALVGAGDHLATAWVISRGALDPERMIASLVTIWTRTLRIA